MLIKRAAIRGLISALVSSVPAQASDLMPPRLYEITAEIGMPHLEENLQYAMTRERHCLQYRDLASAFPILEHPALRRCTLQQTKGLEDETVSLDLVCPGGSGTTGKATWRLGAHLIRGTLDVRLGGKNMRFYQRITAMPVGECEPQARKEAVAPDAR